MKQLQYCRRKSRRRGTGGGSTAAGLVHQVMSQESQLDQAYMHRYDDIKLMGRTRSMGAVARELLLVE